jgi:beta-phosphoglucomutase-like phosphatase (HAD superfamily)
MTSPTPTSLDGTLRQARHLILDFNGAVCRLQDDQARQAVDQMRTILASDIAEIPDQVATTTDPLTVLAYAATISPQLAEQTNAELTRHEVSIALAAQPAGYSHDLISSARESHRTVTVISTYSVDAVSAYLDKASLDDQVGHVIGRNGYSPNSTAGNDLIARALTALNADPAACVIVSESAKILSSANASGVPSIAYARSPSARDLPSGHTDAVVTSLADLVLRLRAHPLPN